MISDLQKLTLNRVAIIDYDRGLHFNIPHEWMFVHQVNYSSETMVITGNIIFDDMGLMNSFLNLSDQILEIEMIDIFEDYILKEFKITAQRQIKYNQNQKGYELFFQDIQSYMLQNSFLGKSYSQGDIVEVMNEFLGELQVKQTIEGSLPFDKPLIIPKHINNLKFFEDEILRMNGTIFGTRHGQKVLANEMMSFDMLEEEDLFTIKTNNPHYKNIIHDFDIKELTISDQEPNIRTYEFSYEEDDFLTNDDNSLDDFKFVHKDNDKDSPIDTIEFKPVFERLTSHRERVRRNNQKHYGMEILVNGYLHREVNTVQDVVVSAGEILPEQSFKGDVVNSGKYIIQMIQDKVQSSVLTQKLFLRRPTQNEAMDPKEIQNV